MSVVDLLVVGGGTAGIVGAKTAARLGASVIMVERDLHPGGDCLWTGCVPSKALLARAATVAAARKATAYGVAVEPGPADLARVMAEVRLARTTIAPVDSVEAIEAVGVTVARGRAVFTGPKTAEIDGVGVTFAHALLATGAEPAVPTIEGLGSATYLTNETVWDLNELPRRLVVIGAGTIGCELGQAFARLGSQVTLVEAAGSILSQEDGKAASVLQAALQDDQVAIHCGASVTRVESGEVVLADGTRLPYDQLLIATGRTPRTGGLGLGAAGVDVEERGVVVVDDQLRTSNRRIYAAGDLTRFPQFTHTAGMLASLAATNAVLGLTRNAAHLLIPRVTFTDPEVAAVGVDARSALGDPQLRLVDLDHSHVDRAIAEGAVNGFTRLIVGQRDRIVGGVVVGPRAGESVGEVTLAIHQGLSTSDLASVVHAYPTYNDGVWNAAVGDARSRLDGTVISGAITTMRKFRQWQSR